MRVITTQTLMEKIDLCREIVDEASGMEIDGVLVDMQSANAIVSVYENLSEPNQAKFIEYPIVRMGMIAWELVDKAKNRKS